MIFLNAAIKMFGVKIIHIVEYKVLGIPQIEERSCSQISRQNLKALAPKLRYS